MSEESWRDALPDDIRESDTLKDVADVGSLAQQFIDQSKYLGTSIRLPGEDANDEARAEFRQKLMDKNTGLMEVPNLEDADSMASIYDTLGRPKEAGDYDRPEVEGIKLDDNKFTPITEAAHKAGISKRQFASIMNEALRIDAEAFQAESGKRNEDTKALKTEWGPAYEEKLATASKLAELTEAPEGLVNAIKEGTVDASTLRWLDKIGAQLGGEASEIINQGQGDNGAVTKSEALMRSQEILETLTDMNQSDPRYSELMKKRMSYMEIYAA